MEPLSFILPREEVEVSKKKRVFSYEREKRKHFSFIIFPLFHKNKNPKD
jgi:hypothetical protein